MTFIAAATLNAQPEHNDTLRTVTWSIYAQGGISGFHGMRGPEGQYTFDKGTFAPAFDMGFFLYPRPWIRFGLGGNYSYLKQSDPGIRANSEVIPDYKFVSGDETYTGTMSIESARIQNRNFTQLAGADLTMGINFMEIWRERESQWFNIWTSIGAGYMHGWNTWTSTVAVDKNFISDDGIFSYNNSEVNSPIENNTFDALYVPLGLSIEFDVIPQFSIALYGQYKYFPMAIDYTPTGIWSAGAGIRINLVGRKQGLKNKKDIINDLREQVNYYSNLVRVDTVLVEVPVAAPVPVVVPVPVPEPEPEPVVVPVPAPEPEPVVVPAPEPEPEPVVAPVPEPKPQSKFVEVDKPLSHYAVQIYAFRIYQHAPDDKIFFNDHPTIYRNGDLRRYVIFAGTIEEARLKLYELRKRYFDAFIVYIDDDGTVKPYVK